MLSICLAYCIVAIVYSFKDLSRFAADIDMLSIRQELYGPINNYLASIQSLAYYYYFQNEFSQDVFTAQAQAYDYYVFLNTYFEIKNGYYNIHTNQYMVQFIQGQQFDLYLQTGQFGIQVMSVDLNEAINQFYQNSYQLQQGLLNQKYGVDSINWPEVTFYATNMVNMLAKIDSMVQNIYDYSNSRAELIKDRWLLIQILACVILAMLLTVCLILHSKYNQKIEFFIILISFQEENAIKQEIQRIKIIQDQLKYNGDLIFNYQFDPELKEIYLDKLTKSNSQVNYDKTFRQSTLNKHQLTMKCFILMNIILYGIFISYIVPLNFYFSNYLNNYQPSIKFYIQLCKQSTSAASAFTSRELIYNINIGQYFFYTSDNITSWLTLFNQSLTIIDQYQDLQLTDQLLTTQYFTKSFNLIRTDNVCLLLSEEDLVTAQFHCDNNYNGILKRGLQITLNSIHAYLQNEYIVNQFTQRTQFIPYEIEMGLIIYSALRSLIIEFKSNLATVTKDLQIFSISTSSGYIVFILLELFILKLYSSYYSKKFEMFKNMIFLVNQEQLFNDVSLERRLKQYIIQNDLL
ncbi:hypothetical protein pb186bvf_002247 [Paramecium bursaria]